MIDDDIDLSLPVKCVYSNIKHNQHYFPALRSHTTMVCLFVGIFVVLYMSFRQSFSSIHTNMYRDNFGFYVLLSISRNT